MPSRYQVQVNFLNEGLSRVLGHDQEGYHTTSGQSSTALVFDSEDAARKAIALARDAFLSRTDAVISMQVNRIGVPEPEPVYSGPRPTAWEKILGDES